ncbi:hypothetical protein [Oceanibacterium hippocampi]|uniref:Uncharacterized protein n=1 Tax=Oceanibacterium hippocampi TaxID=745714 RepID=A0A1Y5S4Z8_9PROT|nr:hypothetical protein [Oceanibacterium hippocampi]SLN32267.1 hypothetical protein OCH7691_01185 [Oceanibacterium hippocampi]
MFRKATSTQLLLLAGIATVAAFAGPLAPAAAAEPTIVTLTQVACQFIESEGGQDRDFMSASKADCETINAASGAERLAAARPLTLKAGRYVFRVTNRDVPYELGFWLRSEGYSAANPLHRLTKVSVSGGGLLEGRTGDYEVELEPGEYVYSCPLNSTPDYRLIVEG